jgi:hypothetical protein
MLSLWFASGSAIHNAQNRPNSALVYPEHNNPRLCTISLNLRANRRQIRHVEIRIFARLVERRLPAFLVNFVHDELVLEVREDLLDDVSCLVVDEMIGAFLELFKPYNPELVIRGLVEVASGYNYAQVK